MTLCGYVLGGCVGMVGDCQGKHTGLRMGVLYVVAAVEKLAGTDGSLDHKSRGWVGGRKVEVVESQLMMADVAKEKGLEARSFACREWCSSCYRS